MRAKYLLIVMSSIMAAVLIVSGLYMVFKRITSFGVIDISSAIISGKLETGSLGLLFTFLGVILLVFGLKARVEVKESLNIKNSEHEFDWSKWKTGDPTVDLFRSIFSLEEIPADVKNLPIIDWISEERIRELVDNTLQGELSQITMSFIKYHLQKEELQQVEKIILKILENTLKGNTIKYDTNNEIRIILRKLFLDEVNNMLSMLRQTVESYFLVKKRIFAGWDRYPVCLPPIHNELALWLENIEKDWMMRINRVIKNYKALAGIGANGEL